VACLDSRQVNDFIGKEKDIKAEQDWAGIISEKLL